MRKVRGLTFRKNDFETFQVAAWLVWLIHDSQWWRVVCVDMYSKTKKGQTRYHIVSFFTREIGWKGGEKKKRNEELKKQDEVKNEKQKKNILTLFLCFTMTDDNGAVNSAKDSDLFCRQRRYFLAD